ncbi:hypothetical protein SUGI_1034410 [Cryptomeria japonica]|nr:hypothetical protein SUGI_1034410 [Cryptomeria japonica]
MQQPEQYCCLWFGVLDIKCFAGVGDGQAEYYQQQRGYLLRISEEDRKKVARSGRTAICLSNSAHIVLFTL